MKWHKIGRNGLSDVNRVEVMRTVNHEQPITPLTQTTCSLARVDAPSGVEETSHVIVASAMGHNTVRDQLSHLLSACVDEYFEERATLPDTPDSALPQANYHLVNTSRTFMSKDNAIIIRWAIKG